ncbi:MAG: orotidine-5'-phosphate decarboxylase [gamma proteobacterium endosymbiont of Trioza apicalis]
MLKKNILLQKTQSTIIVALDYSNINKAINFIKKISPNECKIKIGKEIFISYGPYIIKKIKKMGFDIFLDLKFHDIPSTVAKAVNAAAKLGVWMINIHALGGIKMMIAAKKELKKFKKNKPLLVAVTTLTSMNNKNLNELGINNNIKNYTIKLAKLAQKCGLDGVICSPKEIKQLRYSCGKNFILITPGIRPLNSKIYDQKRILTPLKAQQLNVNYMVIGRPITKSINPSKTLKNIINELNKNKK